MYFHDVGEITFLTPPLQGRFQIQCDCKAILLDLSDVATIIKRANCMSVIFKSHRTPPLLGGEGGPFMRGNFL